jgi:hypothetical protein
MKMKINEYRMTGWLLWGLVAAVPATGVAAEADRIEPEVEQGRAARDLDNPDDHAWFLAQAAARLDVLDRAIGDNDLHQRRIERLQERHRAIRQEERGKSFRTHGRQFFRDLRRLEQDVYGTSGAGRPGRCFVVRS